MATPQDKLDLINKLRSEIAHHNQLYYEQDQPEISDFAYDNLLRQLEELEHLYPETINPESPTQKVGGKALETFSKWQHQVPMQSLKDVFSQAELEEALTKMQLSSETAFIVEEKIDGLSVSLEYEFGHLMRASTRGDGIIGELVTDNIKTISELPLVLPDQSLPLLEIRAEVYMRKADFNQLNSEQINAGKKTFANPRNAAAGSLRQLNPEVTAARNLSILAFNIQQIQGRSFITHKECLEYLQSQNIPTVYSSPLCSNTEAVWTEVCAIQSGRDDLDHLIDGAVIKVNNLNERDLLGVTLKTPRWAVAYKYPPEAKQTKLIDIKIQVGRTGKLTPLAILEPVQVDGSCISSATLHNEDFIKAKDIRIGDIVVIEKAGDVIPAVRQVVLEARLKSGEPFSFPELCPSCQHKVRRLEGQADYLCLNPKCEAQIERHLEYFVGKDGLDIKNLGPGVLAKLRAANLLLTVDDIFRLKDRREELLNLPGFKSKSVDKLIEAIEQAKHLSFDRYLAALGIELVGTTVSKKIAAKYKDFDELLVAEASDLLAIDSIGPSIVDSLLGYLEQPESQLLIANLLNLGVEPQPLETSKNGGWANLSFVLTGSLETLARKEAKLIIEANGGKVLAAVSTKTDVLIAGRDSGAKLTKAQSLGIEIWDEATFQQKLTELKDANN